MPDPLDPRPSFEVGGRVAVVTGSTRGLGAAIARGLAVCGARVVVVGRSTGEAGEVADEVTAAARDAGGEAAGVGADITSPEGRDAVVQTACAAFGSIDILVNNAGIAHRVRAESVTPAEYARVHTVNAEAALFMSQACFPHLRRSGRGSVVNVVSSGIWTGGAGSVLYRSSKSGLHAMTMALAREWATDGVRVNALAPGAFDAGMGAALDPARTAEHLRRTPLGRLGRPAELVPAVLFLVSDASSFVTGTTVRVDGGAVSI